MTSPTQPDEDEMEEEVEFVSEGPVRPVLDYIDLSDSDDEGCSSFGATQDDNVSRQKAQVTSTLERLEQRVAQEKMERANKCREFKTNWRKRRSSYAWDYFEMTANNKVKCLHCDQELAYSNNTSSMLRHYRAMHEPEQAAKRQEASRGSRKAKVDKALMNMIIKDSQPFSMVEDVGFRELINALDPGYHLPNRKSLKAMVDIKYWEAKDNAKEQVMNAVAFSLASCLWVSINMDAMLTVTCYFIDERDQLCSTLIGVQRFPKAHTAEDLAEGHELLMAEWGIRDKVKSLVTNGEPTMASCVRQLNLNHIECIAHTINCIVGESFEDVEELKDLRLKCKNLVIFFRTSPTANQHLVQLLEKMGTQGYSMIMEVDKVWTSTFQMLKRLYDLRAPVGAALASLETRINPLTPLDYEMMKDTLSVLTPIHQASVEISAENKMLASKIIPMMKMLHHAITCKVQTLTMTNLARQLANKLLHRLKEHIFNVESESALTMATLLDPRFKKLGFVSLSKMEEAVNSLKNQCVEMMRTDDDLPVQLEGAPIERSASGGELWWLLDETISCNKSRSSIVANASIEVDCYLAVSNMKRTEDPLEWWNKSKKQYPHLYILAEKQILQKAHGQRELAFRSSTGLDLEAKQCVDMWLKMPGVQPGAFSGRSARRRHVPFVPSNSSTRHTCPVISCGRVYENAMFLDGHLKRFDHSPCDPTIHLKGSPPELFACFACSQNFHTKDLWRKHLEAKVASEASGCHDITQTYQRIVCFACPACFLFFNLRDACLQHMSAKNHFTNSLVMNEIRETAMPIPVPQHAKNRLILLCKETPFNVSCSLCHKLLTSHQAAQAHFNVHCRQGCAVAKADKTIVEVVKRLQVRGQCSVCCKTFLTLAEIVKHRESTQHIVEVNQTMAQALLQYCRFNEIHHVRGIPEAKRESSGFETNRSKKRDDRDCSPAKRQRLNPKLAAGGSTKVVVAWYCECGLQFPEEAAASKHLLAVNQIFHQCGVCGKHMGESSITRLHLSRFHGGAHLSNFLFYCRLCKLEMPRYEDILSHVLVTHSGHTYLKEEEVPEEFATLIKAKPSKIIEDVPLLLSGPPEGRETTGAPSTVKRSWMCRMCEDVFSSKAAVREHCSNVSNHSFQRFICGHCPQRFFKESTVRRHCLTEHDGQVKSSHFCGLCDSMQFDSEGEFLEHYQSLHGNDYYCMEDAQPIAAPSTSQRTCQCMASNDGTEGKGATHTQCMRNLSAEGKCQYVCSPCGVFVSSYGQIKTHVHTKHTALNLDLTFDVVCKTCQESFSGVLSFHKHYHSHHCSLEPCVSSRTHRDNLIPVQPAIKTLNDVKVELDDDEVDDETLRTFIDEAQNEDEKCDSDAEMKQALLLSAEETRKESSELEEALQRSMLEY